MGRVDEPCAGPLSSGLATGFVDLASLARHFSDIPHTNQRRYERTVMALNEAGCGANMREQPVPGSGMPNVICMLPGETEARILIGAHFDKVPRGDGVADNWSGVSLLVELYRYLAMRPRRLTFVFIAFTAEERGLTGSKHYARGMDERQREMTLAMINIDTLGLTTTKVDPAGADKQLLCMLEATAGAIGEPLDKKVLGAVEESDHDVFRRAGIPVIRLHSLDETSMRLIHTHRDRLESFRFDAYQSSYRLLAAYLAVIDAVLSASLSPSASLSQLITARSLAETRRPPG